MNSIEIYKETCASFRHYSRIASNIRVSTIAQATILLSATGYLIRDLELTYAAAVAVLGITITFILMKSHSNYQNKCSILIRSASKIEKILESRLNYPMSVLRSDHRNSINTISGKLLIDSGLFVALMLAFFVQLGNTLYLTMLNNG